MLTPETRATVSQSSPTVVTLRSGAADGAGDASGPPLPACAPSSCSPCGPPGDKSCMGLSASTVVEPGGGANAKCDGSGAPNDTDVKPTSNDGLVAPTAVTRTSKGTPVSASIASTASRIVDV